MREEMSGCGSARFLYSKEAGTGKTTSRKQRRKHSLHSAKSNLKRRESIRETVRLSATQTR
jgi:hypothetical protein